MAEQDVDLIFGNWRGFFAARGLPESRYREMINTIEQVVQTDEFQEIRRRNGWSEMQLSGDDFHAYLESQEQEIGALLRDLGYLK